MYGFKPRQKAAQHLADGGLVHSITGMLGMRKRTPEELLAADAKAQARNQEASVRVAARAVQAEPAPSSPQQGAISSYTGMTAMQRREAAQGLADGGLVARMKSADAGAAPFGSRGLDQLREMVPKMQAMGFGPAKAEAAANARGAAGLKAMIPQIEAMGFKQQPQAAADGGLIRGPGHGTSDSIADEMEPGTFIMPADSTAALGLDNDAEDGGEGEKVPVRVSNGEYELPPDRVQAIGQAVLDAIKGVTHTPTGQGDDESVEGWPTARGFRPRGEPQQFFADGGSVKELQKPSTSPSGLYMQDRAQEIKDQVGSGNYAQAAGTAARTAVQGLGMYGIEAADKVVSPVVDAAKGFGRGVVGDSATSTPAPVATPQPPVAGASAAVGGGRGSVSPPPANPSAPAPSAPTATSAALPWNVTRTGNSYSGANVGGDITIGGDGPRNGGQISTQSAAAADNLALGFRPGRRTPPPEQPGLGFAPAQVSAPVVRNSTNDWAARKALENAATSASSITNTQRFGGRGAENSPAMQEYRARLATDQALQQAQPGMDAAALRENGGLQREGIQQAGATTRTGIQEAGANQRAQGQLAVQQGELDMRRTAQGFQTRAAAQQEQLRGVIADPSASPAARAEAQRALQALNGKSESWKAVALQGGTDAQGNKTESILGAVNERTGEMKRMGSEQGQQIPNGWKQIGTSNGKPVYQDRQGNRHMAA